MSLFRRNVELLQDIQSKSRFIGERKALTGRYNPATGNIEPMRSLLSDPNKIWVRFKDNENAVEAWNFNVVKSSVVNLGVVIEEDEEGELAVKRPLNRYNAETAGDLASAKAAPDVIATASDSVTYKSLDGLRPIATETGLEVTIRSYNTRYGLFPETTFDFASYTPPTSGKYRWAVCYLNLDTLTLSASVASAEQDLVDFDRDDIGGLVTIPPNSIRIVAMFLLNGQTTYNADELYDVRELWTPPNEIKNPTTVTGNYTVLRTDTTIYADASGGGITITLPDATTVTGLEWRIKRINASGGSVTVVDAVGNNIDDVTSYKMTLNLTSRTFHSDGTQYWIH